jgi:hypothetical protein
MEIVYFVLGVVTVLLVLGVAVIVRVGTLVKKLKEEVQFLERGSQNVADGLHRRIDNEVRDLQLQLKDALDFIGDTKDILNHRLDNEVHRRIDDDVRELNSKIDFNEREIFSQLDSRLDKLENKIKQKDLLKG